MAKQHLCPNCLQGDMDPFYEVPGVPVHSVLLLESRKQATEYPRGDIRLALCNVCGFVSNVAFDPELHEYSDRYESTQSYSPTFNSFHRQLATRLVHDYDLVAKNVVEIGCGQGEFLVLLAELGNNRAVGVDPAYDGRVNETIDHPNLEFITEFYSEKHADAGADFICCKMTLEHIPDTAAFVRTVRRSIGERRDVTVFFQIPNASYVFNDLAFWDVYYEHCSYFTESSLRYLFEDAGFEVLKVAAEYGGQYLMIEALPAQPSAAAPARDPDAAEATARQVQYFVDHVFGSQAQWRSRLKSAHAQGQRAVIWGSGSKGVAFLTTLQIGVEIGYAVDINPNKHGTFMAGTGHEIVGPDYLVQYRPDIVIVMNPVYRDEIGRDLARLGLEVTLLTV